MNFYVTTSIPYVNGEPHLGHAMEFVLADVLARYAREQGNKTIFSTGTDEHGGKVADKAKELKLTPKEFTDKISNQFKNLAKDLNISNDRFIRTTDKTHEERVQKIWIALKDDIYKSKYEGWYCKGGETFVPEAAIKENNGICPDHNAPYEKVSEENYFFKLSKYNEQIKKAIESDKLRIIPETRKNEILQVLEDGLEDISISRPKDKISWGVPVPGDDTQVIYVWIDALPNYITVLGYPDEDEYKQFWPANYQVIGKDILRFHAAIWPGILLGLGLALPKTLYVHGFINIDNKKMSKSLGNVVSPHEIIDKYGVDAFRYYFLRHIPSYDDGDFTWEKFKDAYQNELANELGNAVQRTAVMIKNFQNGKLTGAKKINGISKVNDLIGECKFDRALDEIWEAVRALNAYIDKSKPWELSKGNKTEELKKVLNSQVEQLLNISKNLLPFLPNTAKLIQDVFSGTQLKPLDNVLFPRIEA